MTTKKKLRILYNKDTREIVATSEIIVGPPRDLLRKHIDQSTGSTAFIVLPVTKTFKKENYCVAKGKVTKKK